jgi:hypothetical protein
MHLSLVQEQAIAARIALIVGAKEFDRLFLGVQFSEVDCNSLFVFARDEETAAGMEDKYALHISIIASEILKADVGIVMVLPRVVQSLSAASRAH